MLLFVVGFTNTILKKKTHLQSFPVTVTSRFSPFPSGVDQHVAMNQGHPTSDFNKISVQFGEPKIA